MQSTGTKPQATKTMHLKTTIVDLLIDSFTNSSLTINPEIHHPEIHINGYIIKGKFVTTVSRFITVVSEPQSCHPEGVCGS
jgi:hypothetical protein